MNGIKGVEHCKHSSSIKDLAKLEGDDFIIIGGYESGVQMAIWLIENGKKVTLINPTKVDETETSDPSKVLSPYTLEKFSEIENSDLLTCVLGTVKNVTKEGESYCVHLKGKSVIKSSQNPICATGFSLVQKPIEHLMTFRADGFPLLNPETDELHGQENIYLAGPSVRHENHIFCFIYKFRQRFGVIAEDILDKEMCDIKDIISLVKYWKQKGLYLSDLSCCDDECKC